MTTKTNSPTPTERVIAAIPPAYGEPIEGFSDQRKVYGLAPEQQRGYAFAHRELVHAFERAKAEASAQESAQSARIAELEAAAEGYPGIAHDFEVAKARIAELEAFKVNATKSYEDATRRIAALEGALKDCADGLEFALPVASRPKSPELRAARALLGGGK